VMGAFLKVEMARFHPQASFKHRHLF